MEPGMRIGIVLQHIVGRLRIFPRATRGNVAMIFGLALIPLCIAVGVGLDMSRAMITRARLGTALDAAGLAVGSQPGMSQADMQKLAREYFTQNYTADETAYGTPDAVTLSRPSGSQTITLSTQVRMPTVLMRLVGIDTMDVAAKSEITWGQTKLWVALVLDNTGSMCQYPAQPTISSCPTPDPASKIVALKTATHNLLQMLQNAASNDGDVQVSIVPFSKDVNVGTGHVGDSWIDWSNWEAPPPSSMPGSNVGPGSNCPYGTNTSPYGYGCMMSPANNSTAIKTIPSVPAAYNASTTYTSGNQVTYGGNTYMYINSSNKAGKTPSSNPTYWSLQSTLYTGYICPGTDNGRYNTGNGSSTLDASSHHYNGCYDSTVASSSTTTTTHSSTTVCSNKSSCTTASYCGGYPSTSVSVSGNVTTSTQTTCECHSVGAGKSTCTTTPTDTVTTTLYNHTWHANDHSTWTGCIMDRAQDYDTENTAPGGSAKFPAENTDYCLPGTITPLAHDWGTLSSQVDAMTANGNTNQTVGLAWGWQTLTNSDPYNPGEVPEDTRKVLILLTDGLNTQNRWSGDASTIDARTKAICQNIKDDKITVYTVLVMAGSSSMLKGCASDDSKYFELTSADEIVTTFQQIGTQITNLRVSL
jgi:Flp pilus assembly protein TadG